MYGQQALSINELSGPQWQKPYYLNPSELLGRAVVDNRSLFPQHYWIWVAVGVLIGYAVLLNGLGILAATFLNRAHSIFLKLNMDPVKPFFILLCILSSLCFLTLHMPKSISVPSTS